jgi:hypothetical protein
MQIDPQLSWCYGGHIVATKLRYKPGSWYRISDFSGYAERAEDTRKTWQGYYVGFRSFEPRNAQDLVRGRRDNQVAPEARPRQTFQFLALESTLALAAPIRSTIIYLVSPISAVPGNTISIILDDGTNFWVEVVGVGSGDFEGDFDSDFSLGGSIAISLAQPLPRPAMAGNLVQNLSAPEVSLTNALSSVS